MAQVNEEDIYIVAKRFFEQDYHDRGMVKWQGYHLSDHTEDAAQHTKNDKRRAKQQLIEKQSIELISQLLKQAYETQTEISVQLDTKDMNGLNSDFINGKIKGYTEHNTVLLNDTEVLVDQINYVNLIK